MNRPIIFIDLETTGLSKTQDRIIEISLIKYENGKTIDSYYSRFNPNGVPISKEALEKHKISLEDLLDEPLFNEKAQEIVNFIGDCDVGGYNIWYFDLPFLVEELLRANANFNHRNRNYIDPFLIYSKMEPRNLEAVYERFTGKNLSDAHSAAADNGATIEIFQKMCEKYDLPKSNEEIEKLTIDRSSYVDLGGKFQLNKDGKIVFGFGKHKNKLVADVYSFAPDYFDWMMSGDFPQDTKLIITKLISRLSVRV